MKWINTNICYLNDIEVTDPETVSAYPEPDYGDMWTTNTT